MHRSLTTLLSTLLFAGFANCAADAPPPLTDAWSMLPVLDGTEYVGWSSAERGASDIPLFAHSNKDFNNFIAVCGAVPQLQFQAVDRFGPCEAPLHGYLIAEDNSGPGVISRVYFTSGPIAPPSVATYRGERLRVYADDQSQPVYDGRLADWQGGDAVFRPPLTRWTSGALVNYTPIPYQKRVRILLDGLTDDSMYYYQVDARRRLARPPEQAQTLSVLAETAGTPPGQALQRTRFADRDWVLAAGAGMDVFTREEPGTIQFLQLTHAPADIEAARDTHVQLFWNGAKHPSLDLPLAVLFAGRQEQRAFRTLPMVVELGDVRRFTLTLPMPFRKSARVRLENRGRVAHTVHATVDGTPRVPAGDYGELRATWLEQHGPFTPKHRIRAARYRGKGKFVGLIMFVGGRGKADAQSPHPVSFLEGDATTIVDGRAIQGTGTEDYFNAGFYFQGGPYDSPFSALVHFAANLEHGTGQVTAMRWHVLEDVIEFEQGFELRFEPGGYEPLAANDYAALGFFYAK